MNQGAKLTGIELFRGIAAFAVVAIHTPLATTELAKLFDFAVPYFLATSFYLAIYRRRLTGRQYNLKDRALRLLIPFAFWSLFYFLYTICKSVILGEMDQLVNLLQDPVLLVALGRSSAHLYFIPLLLVGTVLVKVFESLIRLKKLKSITLLCLISLASYEALVLSNNDFSLETYSAFQSLSASLSIDSQNSVVRLCLIGLAFALRCLPYIFLAVLLTHPLLEKHLSKLMQSPVCLALLLITLFFVSWFNNFFLLSSLRELSQGYLALLSSIALSNWLKSNALIENLGRLSFGIYLVHVLPLEILQSIHQRIFAGSLFPIQVIDFLLLAILAFLITCRVVYHLSKVELHLNKKQNLPRYIVKIV